MECTSILTVCSVGHKRDSWFAIDSLTGTKVQTLSVDSAPEVCPSNSINQMFIGRTGLSYSSSSCVSRVFFTIIYDYMNRENKL